MTIKVLLIEDDEDDYLLALDCIESIDEVDYDVDWESDGMVVAGGSVDYSKYDVVLCDYRVGGVTGVEIVEAAVRRGVNTPFILLTGHSDREIDYAAMRAGAVDHLVKDRITPEGLEKAIRYAVNAAKASRALKTQSAILGAIMEATDVGMAAIDEDGGVRAKNLRIAELLLGLTASEDDIVASLKELAIQPGLRAGQPLELPRADGDGVVEIRMSPLPGGGCALACYDVTTHKTIEDTLRASKDEAERLSHAKSMFIARLSHEMRTPLHAVIGFGEMLPSASTQDVKEYSDIIVHSGRGLIGKIDQMLELSRMDLGELRNADREAPVLSVLREAAAAAIRNAPDLGRRLKVEAAQPDAVLRGDRRLLANALAEFVANAAKYGDAAAPIEIGAEIADGQLALFVRNRATSGQSRIGADPFESFGQSEQRLDQAHNGLGLGLTYAQAVARLHNGEAHLRPTEDGAATMATIALPTPTDDGARLESDAA